MKSVCVSLLLLVAVLLTGCGGKPAPPPASPPPAAQTPPPAVAPEPEAPPLKSRSESIPVTAVRITPATDGIPPVLHSSDFQPPVPLGDGVNTAGAEDSAFVTWDGNDLYFFFTPDPGIPAEKQLLDGVTGIYHSRRVGEEWQPAERVLLETDTSQALDGCVLVQGGQMWFCSARQGNYRSIDMWTAQLKNGQWTDWQNAGAVLNRDYKIGEMHLTTAGDEIYYHSDGEGGKGGLDIWLTRKSGGEWQTPENVAAVNTTENEGWPFLTADGAELWFTRWYQGTPALFRSKKAGGQWAEPELILSRFAGEPSLDKDGNLYFTHHFFRDGKMLEADIYIARRR